MPSAGRRGSSRGNITGYVFKLARESIPRSQDDLATELGLDRATVQGWESGRRPFTSVAFGQAISVRHKLARLGADPRLLARLDEAAEADHLLDVMLDTKPGTAAVEEHALGWMVLTHSLTELLAWAVVGQQPAFLHREVQPARRRGPVPSAPQLDVAERQTFFANLHTIADRTDRSDDRHVLLHRQACFLAGLDPSGHTAGWLHEAAQKSTAVRTFDTWSPRWPDARSVATSLAKQGDRQVLREFIARAHPDDTCELAGLNYWAYWVGEVGQRQCDDLFMIDKSLVWRGGRLLRHLVDRLQADHAFIDLNIHSLWALLAARRDLVLDDPSTGRDLLASVEELLDQGELSAQSRRELTSILYGLRLSGLTSRGRDDDR